MPIIRGQSKYQPMPQDRMAELVHLIQNERAGVSSPKAITIFEIPLIRSDKFEVMVVSDLFENVLAEDRVSIIKKAYLDLEQKVTQAFGITYEEAIGQHLLPFSVTCHDPSGVANQSELQDAMTAEGAFRLPTGKISLRLPTLFMALDARDRLAINKPNVYWQVQEFVSQIDE